MQIVFTSKKIFASRTSEQQRRKRVAAAVFSLRDNSLKGCGSTRDVPETDSCPGDDSEGKPKRQLGARPKALRRHPGGHLLGNICVPSWAKLSKPQSIPHFLLKSLNFQTLGWRLRWAEVGAFLQEALYTVAIFISPPLPCQGNTCCERESGASCRL